MKKHFDKFAHAFLYGGFAVGALAIFLARYDAQRQFVVLLLLVAFYLTWGFVYHQIRRDATKRLMVEYLVIGLIVITASLFVFIL